MTSSRRPDSAVASAGLRGFYARHPAGALRTSVLRAGPTLIVRAALYRLDTDRRPAATALAEWRTTLVSETGAPVDESDDTLRLAEARAIHVALGYLGFGVEAAERAALPNVAPPNAVLPNEMSAVRTPRLAIHVGPPRPADDPYDDATASSRRVARAPETAMGAAAGGSDDVHPALRDHVADFEALIGVAWHVGLRARRAERWRARLRALDDATPDTRAALERAERRLRSWIVRRETLAVR